MQHTEDRKSRDTNLLKPDGVTVDWLISWTTSSDTEVSDLLQAAGITYPWLYAISFNDRGGGTKSVSGHHRHSWKSTKSNINIFRVYLKLKWNTEKIPPLEIVIVVCKLNLRSSTLKFLNAWLRYEICITLALCRGHDRHQAAAQEFVPLWR